MLRDWPQRRHIHQGIQCVNSEEKQASYNKNAVCIKESIIFNISELQRIFIFRRSKILSANSWPEGDELCWHCQDSGPKHIELQSDICLMDRV